ncbi:E-selectin-like isoform X1 [Brevipalpus obovatus]|uniref:E-selectin-like isoform X1 n=1 Tax=Brevipalpus obovatus TaxID=246614 RepID=UPI003D9E5D94
MLIFSSWCINFSRFLLSLLMLTSRPRNNRSRMPINVQPSTQNSSDWNRRCPQLNAPFNGYIQGVCGPGASPGSRCVYRCYNGYQASGQRVLTCQQGGYWDTSPPTCVSNNPPPNTQITCPPLRPPTYGYMTGSCTPGFASLGCTFTCQDGFKLYGSATVVCGYDGRWAGTMPYCQPPVGFIVVRPGRG